MANKLPCILFVLVSCMPIIVIDRWEGSNVEPSYHLPAYIPLYILGGVPTFLHIHPFIGCQYLSFNFITNYKNGPINHRKFTGALIGAPPDSYTASRVHPNPWVGPPGPLDRPERDTPDVRRVRYLL